MDKFSLILFNNRKALGLVFKERTYQSYKEFNEVTTVETLVNCYDKIGFTWEINDGYIVGTGY